ncbi:MAG: Fic family protein [Myxococcota bacterium]
MAKKTYPSLLEQSEIRRLERRIEEHNEIVKSLSPHKRKILDNFVDITWCYHEFAIEGVVLNHLEIKSALDDRIISNSDLIPNYFDVQAFYKGIQKVRKAGNKKRLTLTNNTIKQLHNIITVSDSNKDLVYRKEIPLHRQYAHDFSQPEKIPYKMRKLGDWLQSSTFRKMPALMMAASIHNKLMSIFPWPNNSGSLARLVMNMILIYKNYPPAMIPAVERQQYYDNIDMDLTHDNDIQMVNFLSKTIFMYLDSIEKKLLQLKKDKI